MNSNGDSKRYKRIVPVEKNKKKDLKEKNDEVEEQHIEETEEKEADIAEYHIEDNDESRELKKRTDDVLKGYLKGNAPTSLTYIGFEKDINAVVENVLSEQDRLKRKKKKEERFQNIKKLGKKLFRRRNDG
jgi:hypothetical protein